MLITAGEESCVAVMTELENQPCFNMTPGLGISEHLILRGGVPGKVSAETTSTPHIYAGPDASLEYNNCEIGHAIRDRLQIWLCDAFSKRHYRIQLNERRKVKVRCAKCEGPGIAHPDAGDEKSLVPMLCGSTAKQIDEPSRTARDAGGTATARGDAVWR